MGIVRIVNWLGKENIAARREGASVRRNLPTLNWNFLSQVVALRSRAGLVVPVTRARPIAQRTNTARDFGECIAFGQKENH